MSSRGVWAVQAARQDKAFLPVTVRTCTHKSHLTDRLMKNSEVAVEDFDLALRLLVYGDRMERPSILNRSTSKAVNWFPVRSFGVT
jgi:hypothetical protein